MDYLIEWIQEGACMYGMDRMDHRYYIPSHTQKDFREIVTATKIKIRC